MAVFLSTYVNKVDRKGRVSIPAQFRASLAKTSLANVVYVWPALGRGALEGADQDYIDVLSDSLESPDLDPEIRETIESFVFGKMMELTIDADGRVVLPKDFAESAGIDEEAAFVGRRKTFQIWNPAALKAHEDSLLDKVHGAGISLSQVIAKAQRGPRSGGDAA